MTAASRFDLSVLENAQKVPGKPRHKTREVKVGDSRHRRRQPDLGAVDDHHRHVRRRRDRQADPRASKRPAASWSASPCPSRRTPARSREIKKRIGIPLICDIHFDYKMALAALDHPIDKIRINPGNIGGMDRFRQVVRKAKDKGIPMRIGVNAGSLERDCAMKYGFPCPPAMVESALRYIEIAESEGYHDIIVSLKSSDVLVGGRGVPAVRQAVRLPDAHRHHRGRQAALRRDQVAPRPRPDPARRHRRHHPHQPAGRPGAGDRRRVRHPASDAAARAPAGADRLPDLRPAGDRPGEDHRRAGGAAARASDCR